MKPARIIVLVVAVAAGGFAALLAGRSPTPQAAAPPPQLQVADVLVAASDIGQGSKIAASNLRWQAWPAEAAAGSNFMRKSEHPNGIEETVGKTTRVTFSAGEPIRDFKAD